MKYEEKVVGNIKEQVLKIGQSREYELVIVGKRRIVSKQGTKLPADQIEDVELGPAGDIFASSGCSIVPTVLVIQQQETLRPNANKSTASEMVRDMEVTTIDAPSTDNEPDV